MLQQLKYINHLNEVYEFGKEGIFVNISEIYDYSWKVTKKNNRVSSIDYTVSTKKLPITIICASEDAGIIAKNKLLEIAEKDVLALQHGKIVVGDYYYKCFVTKSVKRNYLTAKRYMTVDLTLTSDQPYWIKEMVSVFTPDGESTGSGLDYPYDYQYDFFNGVANKSINNTGFVPSNFRLIINGACTDPVVYIAEHAYKVNCVLADGELLTIDSVSKTIKKTALDGTVTSVFSSRDKDSYIFEKIPAGESSVLWSGDFTFEVILLEERSEPKWI